MKKLIYIIFPFFLLFGVMILNAQNLEIRDSLSIQQQKFSIEAVSSIKGKQIKGLSESILSNLLSGKIAGLTVMHQEGEFGINVPEMYIRGKNTYNASFGMLVYVDGFESSFDHLLPEEIESISILKDASALAIYGIRGENGVILVKTKHGTEGKMKIKLDLKGGISTPLKMPQFLNAYKYASLYNEALSNDIGYWSPFYDNNALESYQNDEDPYFFPNVNWRNEVLRSSTEFQQHNISLEGGSSSVKYFTVLGFMNAPKYYVHNKQSAYDDLKNVGEYSKYNIRSNVNIKVNQIVDMIVNIGGSVINSSTPNVDNLFKMLDQLPPNAFPVKNQDGSWAATSVYQDNPLASVYEKGKNTTHKRLLQTDFILSQNLNSIVSGLSLKQAASFWGYGTNGYIINKDYIRYLANQAQDGTISYTNIAGTQAEYLIDEGESTRAQASRTSFSIEASYEKKIKNHALNAMFGGMYSRYVVDGNNLPYLNSGLYGSLNYSYRGKYLSQLSFAYNGSENLPKGHKFGFFPAIGLGWILSEENFMKSENIQFLKLRASAGWVGSSDLGSTRFGYQTYYVPTSNTFNIGAAATTSLSGLQEGRLGNTNISYEKNYKYNLGLDGNIFKKLSFHIDAFYELRDGILAVQDNTVPAIVALTLPYENIGKVSNRGFEVELDYSHHIGKLNYSIFGNVSFARNKIEYQAENTRSEDYLYRTGHPVGQYFGLEAIGLFSSWEEINSTNTPVYTFAPVQPGDIKYKDQNGDGFINENDEVAIGYSNIPEINASLGFELSYKNFDFNACVYGQVHRSVMLSGNTVWAFYNNGQVPAIAENRWVYYPEQNLDTRKTATYPRLTTSANDNNYRNSTFWLKDASFLRLQNLEVGYSFSDKICHFISCNKLRIYAQTSNLFTLSALSDFDPEVMDGYPISKSFALGFNVQF